jgi:hypothetical protein
VLAGDRRVCRLQLPPRVPPAVTPRHAATLTQQDVLSHEVLNPAQQALLRLARLRYGWSR